MTKSTLDFLKRLLDAPGPSGFETAPARLWREEVKRFADEVSADVHGNSVGVVNPKGKPRLMLAGHIDEIGLQVTHVDDEGYLYFAGIGGWDSQVLVGQRVVLAGPKGAVRGVIGKQAIHLMKREDIEKVSKISDLWIDIGAATRAEALERVRVGDAGVLDAGVQEFPNGRVVSRAIYNALRGIPTGLVSVPNRYMHSPNEMVAVEDLDRAARLCAAFARRLAPNTSFVPE